jgi:hypothetical protein
MENRYDVKEDVDLSVAAWDFGERMPKKPG